MAELTPLDILNGYLALITITIAFFISLHIMFRYFKHKKIQYLYVGIVGLFLTEPWWPAAISFVLIFLTGNGLSNEIYFIIGNVGIPLAISLWLLAYSELKSYSDEKRRNVIIGSIIYGIVFLVVFFSLLMADSSLIGILKTPIDVEYRYFVVGYLLSIITIILFTGVSFARESLKSDNPEMQLRGKLIIAAFVSFSVGALMDSALPLNTVSLLIARFILMFSSILFWGGFILPDWMKKILIKE